MHKHLRPVKGEEQYLDFDEETQTYCVFGVESGFAYASYADPEAAVAHFRTDK